MCGTKHSVAHLRRAGEESSGGRKQPKVALALENSGVVAWKVAVG